MGTRALISQNGKPIIATHFDGYLEGLGQDLKTMAALTIENVIKVAEEHTIDFIDNELGEIVKENRIQALMVRHNLSREDILAGKRRGSVISASDYEIGGIIGYSDWAEFQYDIRDNLIYYRTLSGAWHPLDKENKGEWILLIEYPQPIASK